MYVSPLHEKLHNRFREIFGEPHRSVGKDTQWSLPKGHIACIHLLANGSAELPIVWVFDQHDPVNAVTHVTIEAEAHIEDVLTIVRQRIERMPAGHARHLEDVKEQLSGASGAEAGVQAVFDQQPPTES
jgi:hypothetical protein